MMKLQNVPVGDVRWNPWRDKDLYPIGDDQIAGLRESIKDHGFFASVKGRRRNGKVEIGCGHARLEAAKRARLETIPVYVDDDLDDDAMLRLMTDENALQAGANPGAVMNEVAAVTRRLIDVLLPPDNCPEKITRLFNGTKGIKQTRTKLRTGSDVHRTLGVDIIRRYLGQGDPDRSHRPERAIREAISALKQSGKYDDIVDEAIARHPPPTTAAPSTETAVVVRPRPARPARVLDERCARVFPNDHQFHAFREAVTTRAAQRFIPVDEQYALARRIMAPPAARAAGERSLRGPATTRQIGAPAIQRAVQATVEEAARQQRDIDREEREALLRVEREAQIDAVLHSATASLRSLNSSILKLITLADEFPNHPKIGGFGARLDTLSGAIEQLSRKLRGR